MNPKTDTVYVTNNEDNTVSVINGRTGQVTATIGVGALPGAITVNPATDIIYVANSDASTISVINGRTNKVTATVEVGTPQCHLEERGRC